MNCCEEVVLSSTESNVFVGNFREQFLGTWSRYGSTLTNDRMVYSMAGDTYCLYYSSVYWVIYTCTNFGSNSYYIRSAATSVQCLFQATGWTDVINLDSTARFDCSTCKCHYCFGVFKEKCIQLFVSYTMILKGQIYVTFWLLKM